MAQSVERMDIVNIQDTGLTTSIARYTFDLEIWWTDDDGQPRHYGPAEHVWPNDLAGVPLNVMREWAIELVSAAVRVELGIDTWPASG